MQALRLPTAGGPLCPFGSEAREVRDVVRTKTRRSAAAIGLDAAGRAGGRQGALPGGCGGGGKSSLRRFGRSLSRGNEDARFLSGPGEAQVRFRVRAPVGGQISAGPARPVERRRNQRPRTLAAHALLGRRSRVDGPRVSPQVGRGFGRSGHGRRVLGGGAVAARHRAAARQSVVRGQSLGPHRRSGSGRADRAAVGRPAPQRSGHPGPARRGGQPKARPPGAASPPAMRIVPSRRPREGPGPGRRPGAGRHSGVRPQAGVYSSARGAAQANRRAGLSADSGRSQVGPFQSHGPAVSRRGRAAAARVRRLDRGRGRRRLADRQFFWRRRDPGQGANGSRAARLAGRGRRPDRDSRAAPGLPARVAALAPRRADRAIRIAGDQPARSAGRRLGLSGRRQAGRRATAVSAAGRSGRRSLARLDRARHDRACLPSANARRVFPRARLSAGPGPGQASFAANVRGISVPGPGRRTGRSARPPRGGFQDLRAAAAGRMGRDAEKAVSRRADRILGQPLAALELLSMGAARRSQLRGSPVCHAALPGRAGGQAG